MRRNDPSDLVKCVAYLSFFAALIAYLTTTASAQSVLVSNLAEPVRDASAIGNNPNPVSPPPPNEPIWYWAAQSFLPDNSSYSLTSIEAIVGDGSTSPSPVVVAELHNDDNGTIGSLITSFTAPDVSGAQSILTFLPANPVTLAASTKYWFVLGSQAPGDGTYFWSYAEGNGAVGLGILDNYNYSTDSGATWANFGSDNPFFLQVNVQQAGTFEWNVDALGDWTVGANWNPTQAPSTDQDTAIFGGVITVPRTVVVDSAVTVKHVQFDNANTYVIAGAGSVNLDANTGSAAVTVAQGAHEFQGRVNLVDDSYVDVADDATLEFNNRLSLGGNTLTKDGGGALKINNDLNTGGGSIVVLGGTLGGGGAVGGDLLNQAGTVAPGNSPGVLTVTGDYDQNASGSLAIELAGNSISTIDKLNVIGDVTLAGTLDVSLISGFVPAAGQTFDILDWGTLAGIFSTLDLPSLAGLAWDTSQLYTTGALSVVASLPGDYNQNGVVDGADYVVWRKNLGNVASLANDDTPGVGPDDYTRWRAHFGQTAGSGAGAVANTSVPEPATVVLLILAAAGCGPLRRRAK